MKIPFKTAVNFVLLVGLLALQYQNCSSYHDPSPFGTGDEDMASSSSPTDVRLDSPAGVIDVSQVELALSVGGECNTGLSQKHYIEVKLFDANNTPMVVREDTTCPKGSQVLSAECLRATQFRCEHGRYYIHLPISCGAYQGQMQSLYRMVGQLVTVDSKTGQETRDVKSAFDRFFQISWAANACL